MPGCLPDFSTWGSEHPLQRSPCPAPASPRSSPLTPTWCPHTPTCCLGHTGGRFRLRLPHYMSETGTSAHTTLPIPPMPPKPTHSPYPHLSAVTPSLKHLTQSRIHMYFLFPFPALIFPCLLNTKFYLTFPSKM